MVAWSFVMLSSSQQELISLLLFFIGNGGITKPQASLSLHRISLAYYSSQYPPLTMASNALQEGNTHCQSAPCQEHVRGGNSFPSHAVIILCLVRFTFPLFPGHFTLTDPSWKHTALKWLLNGS